ncbi:unnamed protein product [Withania somnifera]
MVFFGGPNFTIELYGQVFFLCLLAGCSITWFNTVCFVLCIKYFPSNRPLALALTVSFNGVSAAIYNLAAISINPSSCHIYLLVNALIPLIASIAALFLILQQPPVDPLPSDAIKHEQFIFIILNLLALVTGLYLLFVRSADSLTARVIFAGAILLLVLPLGIPGIIYAQDWFQHKIFSSFTLQGSGFLLVDADDLEFHREFLSRENSQINVTSYGVNGDGPSLNLSLTRIIGTGGASHRGCCGKIIGKDQLVMLGEEHKAGLLVKRLDFWLYYLAYFCGGTIGLVYSNNLGQISQSLGHSSMTSTLITLYSSFSFFGRLLSAAPDFIRLKLYFARTGWLAIALVPMPIAFFLVAASGNEVALQAGTALIGLSSGFIFAAAVSITSELFGPNSVGVNHNILITNIPIGSLVYGFLAALIYDNNATGGKATFSIIQMMTDTVVCMGRKCYFSTFIWWGCLALLGLVSSVLLFLRTRPAYERFEQNRRTSLLD